jgi:hypothetical protein
MRRSLACVLVLPLVTLLVSRPSPAADIVPPIDERFAAALEEAVRQPPDFRRHVVPLLGRLGCNGRACHGSFQGQGGFQLSLFGYDFKADHANLTAGDEPRANLADPPASLMLQKPLEETPHDGGKRLTRGSWQHRVLLEWIATGAEPATGDVALERLDVTPPEILASHMGTTETLRVVAVWSDGAREDVTPLCRFQSNNDDVATIDEAGLVTVTGPGDTHVVVFYDNGVVPVPVLLPVSDLPPHEVAAADHGKPRLSHRSAEWKKGMDDFFHGEPASRYPDTPTPTPIDSLVVDKLRKLGVVPSDRCTDAEFLRRVSLDLTGTLPTAAEVEAFLADARTDKRERLVDTLLESPSYAAWWATKFCDWTGNSPERNLSIGTESRDLATAAWHEWLRTRIAANVPYDEIVKGIVLARNREDGESYRPYCDRMSGYKQGNFVASLAEQPTLPYFWSRRGFQTPQERALGFAYTFLGVRIQCAECHKHPFDQWTKDDFARFQNFFTRVRFGQAPDAKAEAEAMLADLGVDLALRGGDRAKVIAELAKEGHSVPVNETFIVPPVKRPKPAKPPKNGKPRPDEKLVGGRTATVLGGDEYVIDMLDDPRTVLMEWMLADDNPYFARAIVNRVWASYFNVGIVEPPDDLSLANPPSNAPLLDWLATEFRTRGYDLKWLHRTIVTSATYQASWQTNNTNRLDERNFSRAVPRRIPAEVMLDAIRIATATDADAATMAAAATGRAVAESNMGWGNSGRYALEVFGRSSRVSNCDCDRSSEPSLLQTVFLRNDRDMLAQVSRKGGWVDSIATPHEAAAKQAARRAGKGKPKPEKKTEAIPPAPDIEAMVRTAYLRTLSRPPTPAEAARAQSSVAEAPTLREGLSDLLWALLNTKEFSLNH